MSEQAQRDHVVSLALEWLRTPYVHEGRVKGQCADCTFFAKVFEEAGLIPAVPIPPYSPQAHINRQAAAYMAILSQYARREIKQDEAIPGDVVMYRIARAFSHGAVIMPPGWPEIIHADMNARMVVRDRGDMALLGKVERRFFSFW